MNHQKEVLAAFLQPALEEKGFQLDEQTLNAIRANVQLAERPGDESGEVRTIRLKQSSSGKITASSIKLFNIAQVSIHDLLEFLGKEIGIMLFDDTAKKMIYSIVMLLLEFSPKLKVVFEEQDARVLFAISRLGKKEFSTAEIDHAYRKIFKTGLTEDGLEDSMDVLINYRVVKRTAAKQYVVKEKIKNLSRGA